MFSDFKAFPDSRLSSKGAQAVRPIPITSLLCAALLLLFCFSQEATAQDSDSATDVLRVSTDLITVPVFVTDGRGRRVSGLRRDDFVLLDNGRAVETHYFSSGAERVALLFALDASGSARETISRQRETARALFSRFGTGSRVAVLRFASTAALTASFKSDSSAALEAFNLPALPSGRTAIFDAALEAVRAFSSSDHAERRIVILISDGLDTASRVDAARVVSEARERGISFYVIHLPLFEPRDGRLRVRTPSRGFKDLAEKTGGKYFLLGDVRQALAPRSEIELAPIFGAIEEDLKAQYLIGYYPPEAARDFTPHSIEVTLAGGNNKRLRVETLRKQYLLKRSE